MFFENFAFLVLRLSMFTFSNFDRKAFFIDQWLFLFLLFVGILGDWCYYLNFLAFLASFTTSWLSLYFFFNFELHYVFEIFLLGQGFLWRSWNKRLGISWTAPPVNLFRILSVTSLEQSSTSKSILMPEWFLQILPSIQFLGGHFILNLLMFNFFLFSIVFNINGRFIIFFLFLFGLFFFILLFSIVINVFDNSVAWAVEATHCFYSFVFVIIVAIFLLFLNSLIIYLFIFLFDFSLFSSTLNLFYVLIVDFLGNHFGFDERFGVNFNHGERSVVRQKT